MGFKFWYLKVKFWVFTAIAVCFYILTCSAFIGVFFQETLTEGLTLLALSGGLHHIADACLAEAGKALLDRIFGEEGDGEIDVDEDV